MPGKIPVGPDKAPKYTSATKQQSRNSRKIRGIIVKKAAMVLLSSNDVETANPPAPRRSAKRETGILNSEFIHFSIFFNGFRQNYPR